MRLEYNENCCWTIEKFSLFYDQKRRITAAKENGGVVPDETVCPSAKAE